MMWVSLKTVMNRLPIKDQKAIKARAEKLIAEERRRIRDRNRKCHSLNDNE